MINASTSIDLTLLDRLITNRFFLLAADFILVADIVLSVKYQMSISKLEYAWLVAHLNLGHTILAILAYAFLFSFIFPSLHSAYQNIYEVISGALLKLMKRFKRLNILDDSSIPKEHILLYSILTNNSCVFKAYEDLKKEKESWSELGRFCFSTSLLLIADFVVGFWGYPSMANIFWSYMISLNTSSTLAVILIICVLHLFLILPIFIFGFFPFSPPYLSIEEEIRDEVNKFVQERRLNSEDGTVFTRLSNGELVSIQKGMIIKVQGAENRYEIVHWDYQAAPNEKLTLIVTAQSDE